jgi:UDP-N-acetylglucosamine--N-acetylmuramyl-(pentapeptide) pyrophosphoryl-undecaprenol N-acetylglucosamine transferase
MVKKILILAGGGGHTGYAQILAEELIGKCELCFLVPEEDALSVSRLESYGKVWMITKPRHPTTPTRIFIFRLVRAFFQALDRVSRDVDVVVSTGSNFCIPPALIAWMKGIPIVNLESRVRFSKPSKTASILQHFAKITALQWEEQSRILKGTVFGPILPKRKMEPWKGGYILVTGGTYGYKELFDIVSDSKFKNVVIQTGILDGSKYKKEHLEWKVISLTDKFDELLAGAEVVVSPPGGTPIEAVVYGKPVVIVRYPEWTKAAYPIDTKIFAGKLNAPFLQSLSPTALETAVKEAKMRKVPVLRDGTKTLVEAILSLQNTL